MRKILERDSVSNIDTVRITGNADKTFHGPFMEITEYNEPTVKLVFTLLLVFFIQYYKLCETSIACCVSVCILYLHLKLKTLLLYCLEGSLYSDCICLKLRFRILKSHVERCSRVAWLAYYQNDVNIESPDDN